MSLVAVRKKINQQDRKYCFEIFGYDFILDEEANPWLIEVNTNPCIEEASPLLEELLPRMIGLSQWKSIFSRRCLPINPRHSFPEKIPRTD
jgi:hypothetical protein